MTDRSQQAPSIKSPPATEFTWLTEVDHRREALGMHQQVCMTILGTVKVFDLKLYLDSTGKQCARTTSRKDRRHFHKQGAMWVQFK